MRITEDAYGNFYLIDGEEVCLEVADPLAPDRLFGMLDLRDRGFAARVRDGFEAAWAAGTVVDEV
ncbi:transcriptional regulator, TrmB [Halorubrum sp. Atlit-26R]|nr:transcriptional regulator, TrmB [Halorubrum sp. Atlit-26R]